jgi:polysaccharide deacetylase family protein (PEP-CTERM system associated)
MTVDVEDYYHVSNFSSSINKSEWDNFESRVENNTIRLLEIFSNHEIKATFFVLGWVAERYPQLVHIIHNHGHEIACHGYSHDLIYNQSPSVFRNETIAAKRILEDIIQEPVIGYRAASYSITEQSIWAFDILEELGFKYDSSVFPIRHDRYGIPGAPTKPYTINTPSAKTIIEFPLSTIDILRFRLPISGGGYFRIFPYALTRYAFRKKNKLGEPIIFYLHPWEIDPKQPKVNANALAKFRHYHNLNKCESRLKQLITTFKFTRIDKVLENNGIM